VHEGVSALPPHNTFKDQIDNSRESVLFGVKRRQNREPSAEKFAASNFSK